MNQLHFCGGLPRTGSTVLMNILQQNPKIFTTGTCALTQLISDHILIKSRYRESFQAMSVEQADKAMYGLVQGATRGWFEALTDKPVVISKNRNWSNLFHLYPKSKYIVTVRDIRDIVESFERVNEKISAIHTFSESNALLPSMHSLEKYEYYFNEKNSLLFSLNYELPRLMEAYNKDSSKVIFIRYEDFTKNPNYIIKKIYNFIEEEYFEHDLNHIEQSKMYEHDNAYFRERTDHTTHSSFQFYKESKFTLPVSFHNRILKEYSWFYDGFYKNEE